MTMGKKKSKPKPGSIEYIAKESFKREALTQGRCQNCGSTTWQWHAHHVVYEQHLNDIGAAVWDNRNSMRLCEDCHRRHHNRSAVIPLLKLRAVTIAYAFEVLGLRAYSYLSEKYAGEDPRLEQALATAEGEHGGTGTL
jgi:5-methylcytosine-specific restriction endonuclease McrA